MKTCHPHVIFYKQEYLKILYKHVICFLEYIKIIRVGVLQLDSVPRQLLLVEISVETASEF